MKINRSQIDKLIVARTLYQFTQILSKSEDKYSASAALIILQDAYELVLTAAYDKLFDTSVPEKIKFDDLHKNVIEKIGGIAFSQEMYGMNKARVNTKHYGVLSEPTTTLNFVNISTQAAEKICQTVFNKSFYDIGLLDLISDCESKEFLLKARKLMDKLELFSALIEIRKAIFLEFEKDYSIYDWRQTPQDSTSSILQSLNFSKAPYFCKDKDWIECNVKDPFDYIHLDINQLRYDLLELGIAPADYWNIYRLTPQVAKFEKNSEWHISRESQFLDKKNEIPYEDVNFCFNVATEMIFKKKIHNNKHKSRESKEKYFLNLSSQKKFICKSGCQI